MSQSACLRAFFVFAAKKMPQPTATQSSGDFIQEEAFESFVGSGARLDRDKGIVYGVKLLGMESLNGRVYPPDVLQRHAPQYEGAKAFIDHQPADAKAGRKYKERFGTHKNARYVEGKGVFADHHFNPEHPSAKQYMWDVENAPDSLGFSHTALLKFAAKPDAKGRKVVEEIGKVLSVDLVAEPATTKGLFESTQPAADPNKEESDMDLKDLTLEQLAAARPDLLKAHSEKSADAEKIKTLESQLAETNKKIAAFEAEKKTAERDQLIGEELKAAGLDAANKEQVSDVFLKQLIATEDAAARKELIADRAALLKATESRDDLEGAGGGVPVSGGGLPTKPVTSGYGAAQPNVSSRMTRIREAKGDGKKFGAMYQ